MSLQGLLKWFGGRTLCGAAGSNALLTARYLAASQNIKLAIWQVCLLLHEDKVNVNSLSKLLKRLFCCQTIVTIVTVELARLLAAVEIRQVCAHVHAC